MNFSGFGERFKALLKEKKMSQKKLSELLQINQDTITNYVKEKSYPSAEVIFNICTLLDISSDRLIFGNDLPHKDRYKINNYNEMLLMEVEKQYSASELLLTSDEKLMILKHREGDLIIVDKVHHLLKGEVGELNELEMDLILKYRKIDPREQEDVYDNLCWRYEREHQKKISYESKIG